MADTTFIKLVIEPHMRRWLAAQFPGHVFEERSVALPGGVFKCDAVSADQSIVASFMCNRPRTATGNLNTGGLMKARSEVHGLKSMVATRRLIVCTDEGFRQLAMRQTKRFGTEGIEFLHCELPDDLQRLLNDNLNASSKEQRNRND